MTDRPESRPGLVFHPQDPEGGPGSVHVKEPASGRFFRMSELEAFLLSRMDGTRGLEDLRALSAERGHALSTAYLRNLISTFENLGLLEGSSGARAREKDWLGTLLFLRVPLLNPTPWLRGPARLWSLLYRREAVVPLFALVLSALFALLWDLERLGSLGLAHLTPAGLPWLLLAVLFVKLLHELAHAAAARRHGCEVRTFGIALLLFVPCFYCDTSDAWALRRRSQRMEIGAAGIVVELLVAALAAHVWAFTAPGAVNSIAFFLMTVSFAATLLFNANPLLRFDGYYILSDLLNIPNLQAKAFGRLGHLFWNRWMGLSLRVDPSTSSREARILTVFGLASACYRFLLAFLIAQLLFSLFFPLLGLFLMLAVLWKFLLGPLIGLARTLWKHRWELRPKAYPTALLSALLLLGLPFLLLPFHASRVHPCLVETVEPAEVFSPLQATLASWTVEKGDPVRRGQVLGRLEAGEIAHRLALARLDREAARRRLHALEAGEGGEAGLYPEAREKVEAAEDLCRRLEEDGSKLELLAPVDGFVLDLRGGLDQGARLEQGERLAAIGPLGPRRVRALLREQDLEGISPEQEVSVWVPLEGGRRLEGRIRKVDRYSVEELRSSPLSARHGGTVPMKPAGRRSETPLSPYFRVLVQLGPASADLPAGLSGRLLVPDRSRPLLSRLIGSCLRRLDRVF